MDKTSNQQGLGLRSWLAILAGGYALSPIDLVPDVPIIGWGDDAVVIVVALALILGITALQLVMNRQGQKGGE